MNMEIQIHYFYN